MLKPLRSFLNFIQNNNNDDNGKSNSNNMSGLMEEIIDANDVNYSVATHNDPAYDPLEMRKSNNNNDFDLEDIELSITGSIIKTIHGSNNNNENKSDQLLSDYEEDEDQYENCVKDSRKLVIETDTIEDLEDFIKCEKIEVKKFEKFETKDESDILSEIEGEDEEEISSNTNEIIKENVIDVSKENDFSNIGEQQLAIKEEEQIDGAKLSQPIISRSPPSTQENISKLEDNTEEPLTIIISQGSELSTQTSGEIQPPPSLVQVKTIPPEITPNNDDNVTEGEELNCEEELRSDGSDSGLGSEPSHNSSSVLQQHCNDTRCSSGLKQSTPPAKPTPTQRPPRSSLKRRSSELLDSTADVSNSKKQKRNIQFEGVTVYYFPRQQGNCCVPSQGGCSLGMANSHNQIRYLTLAEHSSEQRKQHRLQLAEINPRSSSSEETDSDEEPSDSSSDGDSEAYGFLQPISAKQRRALLKVAGVRKFDPTEKDECREIRTSREVCGCTCRVYCDPETCSCSQGGIKCQVDRQSFPCGCTRDGCGNVVGRVEFNPGRVRTHYIHTVMRLEMEKKQEKIQIATPEYQAPPPQWRVPAQNMSMCDFNLLYSNGGQSGGVVDNSRNSRNVGVINSVVPAPHESLDLHYAYRDDYNPTTTYPSTIYDPCGYPSTSTAPYLDPGIIVDNTPSPVPYDTSHYSTIHSYAPETRVPTTFDQYGYFEQQPMPPKPIETPPVIIETTPNSSYIDLAGPVSNVARNLLETTRFTSALPIAAEQHEEDVQQQSVIVESNENLSEIIKKSIVETVSA